MANQEHLQTPSPGDFWSQVPVVMFTVAAVVAIVIVNTHTEAAALPATAPPAAVSPATDVRLEPVDCADCGEVIAIRTPTDAEAADRPAAVELDVRMSDGIVRTFKQPAPHLEVGDRVQVIGDSVAARG